MTVRIVTDSTCDLPEKLVHDLGITIVPLTVNFGTESYIDGIEMDADQFYQKLSGSPSLPTTSQPSPADFSRIYQELSQSADGIVSIHISQKLSGTYNSALLARDSMPAGCPIEIIDSLKGSMGVGLVAVQAARAAQFGASLAEVVQTAGEAIGRTHFFGMVDSLDYLQKGGRIGKARALLGTLLQIKPLLQSEGGEILPLGKARTRKKGLDRLFEMARQHPNIQDMAVLYANTPSDARDLIERIAPFVGRDKIFESRIGPVIGTYLGPGTIAIGITESAPQTT